MRPSSSRHSLAISLARSSACEHGTMIASTRIRRLAAPGWGGEARQHPAVALCLRDQPLLGRPVIGPLTATAWTGTGASRTMSGDA